MKFQNVFLGSCFVVVLLYDVLSLVIAMYHIAHLSSMTHDHFLLDILEKVMEGHGS